MTIWATSVPLRVHFLLISLALTSTQPAPSTPPALRWKEGGVGGDGGEKMSRKQTIKALQSVSSLHPSFPPSC